MRRFLIYNPHGIGDVLFTTPLVRALRGAFPEARIGYLCNRRVEGLVRTNPRVDHVFVFEKDECRSLWKKSPAESLWKFLLFLREIQQFHFDTLVDFSLNWHASFFASLLGIRSRIGFDFRHRGRFLTERLYLEGFED